MRNDFCELSDKEFLNIIKFHSEQVKDYLENNKTDGNITLPISSSIKSSKILCVFFPRKFT